MFRTRLTLGTLLTVLFSLIVTFAARNGHTAGSVVSHSQPGLQTGFTITSPAAGSLVPCGQPVTVTWTGGNPTDNVAVVLIDQATFSVYQGFGVVPNTGSQVVTIGPGSCGRQSLFYVEDSPRTTWTYGPVFNVACSNSISIADGDVAGLIAAINTANASTCLTTINLAPNGTYTLTSVAEDDGYAGGAGLPYIRHTLTINGNGATIQRSSAAGTPDFRIIYVFLSDLTLNSVTIRGGRGGNVNRGGGGIGMIGSNLVVTSSTITDNVGFGAGGGGIGSFISTFTIENSTISNNTSFSGYGGGGIINFASPAGSRIISSTIFENQNDLGRGDAIANAFSVPGSIVVKNSILASPTRGVSDDCYPAGTVVSSLGHNIVSDSTCVLTGPGDLENINPLLGPLANNGGLTATHLPLANSPALDAVPTPDCTDVNGAPLTVDQRGISRPQGPACDIGSVEAPPSADTTAPTVTCPAPATAFADSNCQAQVPDVLSTATASDDSGNVTLSQSPAAGTLVGLGTTTITVTATDAANNSASCTATLTVTDNTRPTVTCPSPVTASADSDCQALVPNVLSGVNASDSCGAVTLSQSPAAGTPVGLGATTITVTATDAANNSDTCTTTFTVTDSTPPSVSCPAPVTASADGNCQASVPNVLAGVNASDNCGAVTLSQSPAAGTLVGLGATTITVTATDAAHNSTSCTTTFTVTDHTPPSFTSAATVDQPVLWPPNHSMIDVTVNYSAVDCNAPACTLSVTSNEPVNGTGDGDMAPDWEIVDAQHVRLRAERAGNGNGRIYTITVTCVDAGGNSSGRSVNVNVPKSQK